MGMLLCIPLILAGIAILAYAVSCEPKLEPKPDLKPDPKPEPKPKPENG